MRHGIGYYLATLAACFVLFVPFCMAEGAPERRTEHTVTQGEGAQASAATIDVAAWLAGHWIGEGLGGRCEEFWTAPRGGQMLGMFRYDRDGKPAFSELITITESDGGLVMSLKHFNPDLTGWEEKDQTVDFRLLAFTREELFFDGITYRREGECGLKVFLAMKTNDGFREEVFSYRCASGPSQDAVPAVSSRNETDRNLLQEELRETETAFAQTMADRDHGSFSDFLAEETVFFAGEIELRGKEAVAAAWKGFFNGPDAPFSWSPEAVSVLDSGTLGLNAGPVFDPQGNRVGTFNSVWRREPDGTWRIVFDRGCPPCRRPHSPDPEGDGTAP